MMADFASMSAAFEQIAAWITLIAFFFSVIGVSIITGLLIAILLVMLLGAIRSICR